MGQKINQNNFLSWKIITPLILIVLAGGLYYLPSILGSGEETWIEPISVTGAKQGEHWHAEYEVNVCGERLTQFKYSDGDVHTHGDGLIHIHPHSSETAGQSANLKAFIDSVGGVMSDTRLWLPYHDVDSADGCGGQPAEFRVYVNGDPVRTPTMYKPQDGDNIEFIIREKTTK